MVKEEPAAEWVDDGSLPLDGEGNLPFYFLDAHEEPSQPGVVHLFGKVRPSLHVSDVYMLFSEELVQIL